MIGSSEKKQLTAKEYKERYLGMAVISELTSLIPVNISLINFKADLGKVESGKKILKKDQNISNENIKKNITLEGLVFGDENTLESSLAAFIVKLDESPTFEQISIKQNSIKPYKDNKVLHFLIEMKIPG
jgi:hypothetical protein